MGLKKIFIFGIVWVTNVIATGSVTVFNPNGSIATYTTNIQAGINACPVGGTVSVPAGTYTEAVYVNKGIALVGNGTPTITTQGLGNTNTVTFKGTLTNNASISGFKITGATGDLPNGNGIYCNQGSPTITTNILTGNTYDGIICLDHSSPSITNNTILGNGYYGIHCFYYSSPFITNNIISGNSNSGISCSFSSPIHHQ